MANDDLFEGALNLEDSSYALGYEQGVADGSQAGRVEGRIFGLEKGFEKFLDMGKLHGRTRIWSSRLALAAEEKLESSPLALASNPRLKKNVESLKSHTSLYDISTANDEDSVADFDERKKRATSKVKVIERSLGEHVSQTTTEPEMDVDAPPKGVRLARTTASQSAGAEKNLEDFGLERNIRRTS